jgi:aminomuconate-semialdehyde/2-hydroxymuconate-6-semialdehyde dehydrogenase
MTSRSIEKPESCAHFIGGRFVESRSGKVFATVNPATGETVSSVSLGEAAEIDAAVKAAEAGAAEFARFSAEDRGKLLRRIGDAIEAEKDTLARLESLDTGKPLSETLHGDIPRAARNFHAFADLAAHQPCQTWMGADGAKHTVYREKVGVVGLITPWNFPLHLATWKIAPALAQGNTVILKPAELSPLTANALCALLQDCGVPPGVVNVVQGLGAGSAGEALVKHPGVRAISFTGETTTGTHIMAAAAPSLKKLSFELGGKGATVVFADADLEVAAQTAALAAFRNAGQVCLAGSRLIVEESCLTKVLGMVQHHVAQLRLGDPFDLSTTLGSLISFEHRDKVAAFVDEARSIKGIEILCGGKAPSHLPSGAFYEPTIILGAKQDSRLIQEEIFGPVLTVQTFKTETEALELLNGTPYGLSCSIFTRDTARATRVTRAARFGLVWLNCWNVRDLHVAFGGMKRSGIGREGGQHSLDFFSEFKTVTVASP